MNFQELLTRMKHLDQPLEEGDKGDMDHDGKDEEDSEEWKQNRDTAIKKAQGEDQVDEDAVDECGMDMGPSSSMKQPDNVNMNVSLNGSGAGGIRDLLDILRNMDQGDEGDDLGQMIGKMDHPDKEPLISSELGIDEFANSPDGTAMAEPVYAPASAATPSGDDLHRSHGAYAAAQRGDNPMAISERLENLYQKIKLREGSKNLAAKKDRKKKVNEGSEFGGSYAERLARKVFDLNPKLDTSGRADELLKTGYQTAVIDLGEKMDAKRSRRTASHMFGYDEDFPSDFVSAYSYLQKQNLSEEDSNETQTILSLLKDFVKTREEPEDRKVVAGIYKAFQQGMDQGFAALHDAWEFDIDSDFTYFARRHGVDLNDIADSAGIDTDRMMEGSGPKEKQHSKYVDRSSPESQAKVKAAKDNAAAAEKAKPGKQLLSKIKSK